MYFALVVVLGEEFLRHLVKGCKRGSEVAEGDCLGPILEPGGDGIEVLGDGLAEGGELGAEEFLPCGCLCFYGADICFGCFVEIADYSGFLRGGRGGANILSFVLLYPSHECGACDLILTRNEGEVAEFSKLCNSHAFKR